MREFLQGIEMKAIFLDIDGVVCLHKTNCDDEEVFDADCCRRLKEIMRQTGSKLVLSSTWRLFPESIRDMLRQFKPFGIVKEDWEKEPANPPVYADKLGQYHRDGWFLIGYTGAHGIANGLDSFVEAGKALQGIRFSSLYSGSGQTEMIWDRRSI